jgi:DHA1 family tetracycline resistance protein-like MFS transporter
MQPRKRRILFLVLGLLFIDMLTQGMVYPSFPELLKLLTGKDLQAASQLYGFLAASYAVAELIGSPILGMLSDRFGRKRILVFAAISSSIAFAISAMATQVSMLFAGYALAGLTSAILVVTNASIADITEPEERAKCFGYVGAVVGLGFVVGPAIGALIASAGLRAPFWLASGLLFTAGIVILFALPESLEKKNDEVALELRNFAPWRSFAALGRYPLVRRLAVTILLNALALQMLIAVWVPYCTYRYNFGVAQNGWLLAGFGITMAFTQGVLVPIIVPRIGNRRALTIGLTVSCITYIGYGLAATWVAIVAVTMLGSFGALDEPALQAVVTNEVSETDQGTIQGGMSMIGSLMGIVGPVAGAFLFSRFSGPGAIAEIPGMTYFAGAACVVIGLGFAMSALRRHPMRKLPASTDNS